MQVLARSAVLWSAVFAGATTGAQTPLYSFYGMEEDKLGYSVSGAGDVNADGVADLVVGGGWARRAWVFSGIDGSTLYALGMDGNPAFGHFGRSVSGAGDVNGDGFDDVIVGAKKADTTGQDSGSAHVFSGRNGSVLYTFDGVSADDWFGRSVSDAGDVNGDGFDDVLVGAPQADNNGPVAGSARAFSGVDGSILYSFDGDALGDRFGHSVSGAGDVNGDGFADLIVGADQNWVQSPGYARVFSGVDGSTLYTFTGDSSQDDFGYSVGGAGDVNADGLDDLIVGATRPTNPGQPGYTRVFSGADGSILHNFEGYSDGDRFGYSVSGAGDVDGDGFDDMVIGAKHDGTARVFSGRNGSVLMTVAGTWGEGYAHSVSGAGDVNGDGLDDVIIGAPSDDHNGPISGSAYVFSYCGVHDATYCSPAVLNSGGHAGRILACGSAAVADDGLTLEAIRLPHDQWGYFLNSEVPSFVFPVSNSQGALCLGGAIGRYAGHAFNTGSTGSGSLLLDLGNTPTPTGAVAIQHGETWYFQCWYRDSNAGPTSNFTDAISVTFEWF